MTVDSNRLRELVDRLVASGPKAAHVSASECHEITDDVLELLEQLSSARDAIAYALRRVGTDAEFAYHMVFTETFDRLIRAHAMFEGRDPGLVREEILKRTGALPQSRCAADREFLADGGRI